MSMPDRLEDYVAVDWIAAALVTTAVTGRCDGLVLNPGGPPWSLLGAVEALKSVLTERLGMQLKIRRESRPVPETVLLDSHERLRVL